MLLIIDIPPSLNDSAIQEREIKINVEPTDTIEDVKLKLSLSIYIKNLKKVDLYFGRTKLTDVTPVHALKLLSGDCLQMRRIRSGGCCRVF